jgi:parallel beta-helix repeat protein
VMTPRTSPISAASTFFYGPPDRRRRRPGRRQSQHSSPQPERPQPAASAVRGTSYASSVEVGIPSTEPPSYRGHVRRKPILLALIFSAFFVLNLTRASSAPPTLVAPQLSASVTGTEVSLTWTDAGGENSYYVMRLPPAAVTWTQIAQLHANTLQYKDSGLSTSTTYHYVVVATRGWKQMNANAVQVTTGVTPSLAPTPSPLPSLAASPSPNPSPSPSLSSYPSPSPSPSPRPSSSPSPVPVCDGVQVAAGADLRAVMAAVTTPATFCLAAGTYELGANSLHFDSGDVIVGQPVTFGPKGQVTAPTAIHSTAQTGVIEAQSGDTTLTVENLDLCCAPGPGNQYGNGIDGQFETLRALTVRNSRIHGNASTGIGGVGQGLIVDHSEIDHNGSGNGGIDAGIKTVHYAEIRNSYIHDNNPQGIWWDCDAPGGIVENSTVEANARAGVMVEISSGDATSPRSLPPWGSYGFTIRNNHVEGNNTSNTAPYAGIYVTSSMNVNVDGNTVINNTGQNIRVQNDSRAGQGHDGCSSGFFSANDVAQNNQYGPLDITDCTLAGVTCTNSTKIL